MGKATANLNSALDQLVQLLQQETALYQSMLGTMDPEKEALVASDASALDRASREKESILLKLQALENQRCAMADELADMLACTPRELTLFEIARRVGEPHAGRLRQAGDILKRLLKTLGEENRRQKEIFDHSLAIMQEAFALLHTMTATASVYRRTGNVHSTRPTGNLVSGEV